MVALDYRIPTSKLYVTVQPEGGETMPGETVFPRPFGQCNRHNPKRTTFSETESETVSNPITV
jgi:hypothetical protein